MDAVFFITYRRTIKNDSDEPVSPLSLLFTQYLYVCQVPSGGLVLVEPAA